MPYQLGDEAILERGSMGANLIAYPVYHCLFASNMERAHVHQYSAHQ